MARNGTGGLDELSRTLRELRRPPGQPALMTLEQAAAATGFSVSKVNRIERGKTIPTPGDAVALAKAYGAGLGTRALVRQLADAVKASSHRVVLSRADREGFQRRLGEIERASVVIREFSPIIIPGLLQTSEYMWAIAATGTTDRARAAAFVSARLARQSILDEPGRQITILMTEGSLGWTGGADAPAMIRQLDHIATVAEKPTVRVGIIPFGTPAATFPVSSWTLYDERAACPGILGNQVILNAPDVDPYIEQFEQLEPLAVFGSAVREVIAGAVERYKRLS